MFNKYIYNINDFIIWLVCCCCCIHAIYTTDQFPYIANDEKCTIDRTQLQTQLIYTAKYAPFAVEMHLVSVHVLTLWLPI